MIPKHTLSLTGFTIGFLILICQLSGSSATAGVGGTKILGVNTAAPTSDPFLSSSRYRGGISGDTIVFHVAQFGRNQPAWFYSYDRGVTWDSAVTQLDNVYSLWYMDYHSSGWFSGKSGFHTSWRYRTSANRPLYRHVSAPYTVSAMTEPVRALGLSTDLSYYSVVCANDSEQFFLNLMANVGTPLIVYRSTNNFATYTRSEPRHFRVTSGGSTQNGMRANIQMGEDGRPTITVLDVGTHAFYRLKWNGSIWDSTMITNSITGLPERGYAYAEMNGKGHLVYMRDSDNRWFHWWDSGGAKWAVDTSSAVVTWSGLGAQQLSVVNTGVNARLYMFYMVTTGRDSAIVLKTWTETNGWDADSTVIVPNAHCTWPQCPPYVPAGYDSVAVVWKSNATNLVYEVNVATVTAGVSDTTPPNQITDLKVQTASASSATLSWTAPGDDQNSGTASQYDLRYSSSTITTANWNLATAAVGEPSPLLAGTNQTFTVSGLNQGATYYFAMRAVDESGNWSVMSNVTSGTTTSDTTPPAPISNLSAVTGPVSGTINLSWTAPGDDQNSGTASQYDLRYSSSTITTANWNLATAAVGEPSPLLAGTNQTFTVSGLNQGATYYFAMRAVDESGNWSVMSNVTSGTTTSDTTPPDPIANLSSVAGTVNGTIDLAWTAPGDDGSIGTASSYLIKYSLDSITDNNWPLATVYSAPINPLPSGSTEDLELDSLVPGDVYFMAIEAIDDAGNHSLLSNIASARAYLGIQSSISVPVAVGYTTAGHALLSMPSYRGGRQGDTLIMVAAQFGSNQTGWTVSYDRGTTWHDVRARWMTMNSGTQTWYSPDHSAAWFAGGLHIGFRGYAGTDPAGYRYVAAPYAGEANMESVDIPAPGTDTYYPVVVANGADDVWFFDVSEGSGRDNLRYWHSTNRFATPVTPGRVCTITDDPQNSWSMGVIMGANGYPKVSIFKFTSGFSIWTYNPATQMFDSSLVVASDIGGLGRSYAQAEMNGLDHIVYTGGWKGPLVHFYETSEGHFDSTIVSVSSVETYAPQLCVYGEGATARLYVAYVDSDSAVCVKGWTLATGWDADSIVVSGTGHVALDPALVPQVPSSWGFLPIWYHNLNDNNLYFVKLYLSPLAVRTNDNWSALSTVVSGTTTADVTPPAPIMSLGPVTGSKDGTIDLTWTATGDDGTNGTASSYLIKYSLDSITDANWPLAAVYPSSLAPQPSGSIEHLTLDNLTPGKVYFVAIEAIDKATNRSALSNVASAGACLYKDAKTDNSGGDLPRQYSLSQNYPNPFNPSTTIEYALPSDSRVLITVLNVLGQNVSTLVDREQPAGRYRVVWEGQDASGVALATGVYFCCLRADGFFKTTKMVLLR